jgi:hypothetical protein
LLVALTNSVNKSYQQDFDMARRKATVTRVKKTLHVLPQTAEFIEDSASSRGIYESSIIDEAIALLRNKNEHLSSVA